MKKRKIAVLLVIMVFVLFSSCIFERKQKQDNTTNSVEKPVSPEQPGNSGTNIKEKSPGQELPLPPESKDPIVKEQIKDTVGVY
jgi:hypothetical protein